MSLKVLGISTSPRANGNSDLLLRKALEGAESGGAATEYVSLRGLSIGPCVACDACCKTGVCRIQDDYQGVFTKMLEVDRLIFASPIYFMSVCAQGKLLIDRCQCLWSRKYVLEKPVSSAGPEDRRALVIAVGGSKSKKMFDCVRLTMKYCFDVLDMTYAANLFVNQIDQRGDIQKHPSAMDEAFRLGNQLVTVGGPPPKKAVNVELF